MAFVTDDHYYPGRPGLDIETHTVYLHVSVGCYPGGRIGAYKLSIDIE